MGGFLGRYQSMSLGTGKASFSSVFYTVSKQQNWFY